MFSVVALFFVLFAAYRSPRVRNILLVALFFFGMFMGVLRLYQQYSQPEEGEEQTAEQSMLEKERLSAELLENPPDLVDWVSLAFTVGIVVVIGAIAWLVWQRRNYFLNRKPPLEIISEEVESTLAEIRSGAELRDAVLRCYADMGQALRKGLGLVRQDGMTPREFEEVLGRAELPRESVEQLTRLFEKVRYGGRIADERDKHEAITCLESIVKAAGEQLEQPV
jgi:hypothetical protein